MNLSGKNVTQSLTEGEGNTQVGHNSGSITVGISEERFIEEMLRKDTRIDTLVAEKTELLQKVGELEKAYIQRELDELRLEKTGLEARLADSDKAFEEHQERASQLQKLLEDQATVMALGQNRIHSAIEAFAQLKDEEVDALFEEVEQQGLMLAANAAYGRGITAEDALRWHDAYTHYKRAASLSDEFEHLAAYARMCWRLAKGDESIRVNERLVEMSKHTHGENSPDYAICLNNLAVAVAAQGRYEEAEGLYREALRIDAETIGDAHPDYAIRLNNMALVVKAQGRYEEAEGLYREAMKIDAETIGTAHPSYAIDLINLAGVVRAQRRYEEAEGLYREAVKIDAEMIGTAHPDYAIHLNNLAGVVEAQGRYEEAEGLYREALKIDAATIGAEHPSYAIHLGNLGRCRAAQGEMDEARDLLNQSLKIFQKALPEDHPNIAETERRLAALPN